MRFSSDVENFRGILERRRRYAIEINPHGKGVLSLVRFVGTRDCPLESPAGQWLALDIERFLDKLESETAK